jgi:drug/metabolite transporter (DMT)-like permease
MVDAKRGVWFGLAAALTFAIAAPVAKHLEASVASAQLLAGLLYLGAFAALSAARAVRGPTHETRLQRGDVPALAGLVASGGVVAPVLLLIGLQRLSGAQGSLLLNLEGPFTVAVAVLVAGEYLDRRTGAGAAAIFAGGVLLSWAAPAGHTSAIGALCVAGACLMWAVDNNLTQRLTLRDPFAVVLVKTGTAGAINTGLAVALGATIPGLGVLAGALALGAVAYGASVLLDAYALRLLGAAREAAIFASAPFLGAVLAVPILSESITGREAIAGAVMLAGVAAMLVTEHAHSHDHPVVTHDHAHTHDLHHQHCHDAGVDPGEPHAHSHHHDPLEHVHAHSSDAHHRHQH